MTMQQAQPVDEYATIQSRTERDKALRVREAWLALLRAWEEMYDLPRAIPTRREREG